MRPSPSVLQLNEIRMGSQRSYRLPQFHVLILVWSLSHKNPVEKPKPNAQDPVPKTPPETDEHDTLQK